MGFLDSLGLGAGPRRREAPSADTETVRKIAAALDALPPERARYIAAFAYLLTRVANADRQITDDETREMERLVHETGGLPAEQAVMVVQIAKTQNRLFGGVENFLVTREFNNIATEEQKIALLNCLFAVSAADLSISSVEEAAIHQIASELLIDHADLIAVKSTYRDRLAVLKKAPDAPASRTD